jgi:addiction module HigA family antidote
MPAFDPLKAAGSVSSSVWVAFLDRSNSTPEPGTHTYGPPSARTAGLRRRAAAFQVSRPALSSLPNGNAGLTGGIALRLEKAFGVKMDTLIRMQSAYDVARARKDETKFM